jgi:hypothetical protein
MGLDPFGSVEQPLKVFPETEATRPTGLLDLQVSWAEPVKFAPLMETLKTPISVDVEEPAVPLKVPQ